jgi:hypothetical protein
MLASVSDDGTAKVWAVEPLKMEWRSGKVLPVEGSVGGEPDQGCVRTLLGHTRNVTLCRWAAMTPDPYDRTLIT